MRKVIVFQHVAHRILGTLNPTLKSHKLNIRYINFDRTPHEHPSIDRYNGLIVLGGHMGVYEADKYQHIKTELKLIEEALKKDIPILGICLGAQLLAHALGAEVKKHTIKEIGWCDVDFNQEALNDPLFNHFRPKEKLFQLHGDAFAIPDSATKLASSELCPSQAFRYGKKVYGLQFHLEVDEAMIHRWLSYESNLRDIESMNGAVTVDQINVDTSKYIQHSIDLSLQTFTKFVDLFGLPKRPIALGSGHGSPKKSI